MAEPLLHLVRTADWRAALAVDRIDPLPGLGFVHLSRADQVHLPANRLFAGTDDLLLLALDPDRLPEVRWEPGVPGDPASMLFPHAYGPVPTSAVLAVLPFRPVAGGFAPPVMPAVDPAGRAALSETSVLRRTATTEVPVTGGWAVLTEAVPLSHAHQALLIPGGTDAATLTREADEVLGGAGLSHRRVVLVGAHHEATVAAAQDAGWQVERLVTMIADPGGPGGDCVRQVDLSRLRARMDADWQHESPSMDDATRTQLADRYDLEAQVVDLRHLAVLEAGEPVARAILKLDGATAELDAVETPHAHRGRGHGDALVAAAKALAAESGCDLLVLSTEADDWPAAWYARRGFSEVGRRWVLSR